MAVFLAANIWAANAQSYNSLIATRVVGGLGGGIIEAIGPLIVSELFPQHQLGRAMVTYIGFLSIGSGLGPVSAGLIGTHLGSWRWFFGLCSILIGVNLITSILMLPETSYAAEWDIVGSDMIKDDSSAEVNAENVEEGKTPIVTTAAAQSSESTGSFEMWKARSFFLPWNMADITRPSNTRWPAIALLLEPFTLLLTPAVIITTLVFGVNIGWTVIISIVLATVYQSPPHLWSAQDVGLLNMAPVVGLFLGLPFGGYFADLLSTRAKKLAGGYHNPRSRLPLVIMGALVSPTGCLVIGFSLRPDNFSWIGTAIGWAMLTFGLTGASNVMVTYAVDTFRTRAGHVGVLVNVVKNCIGFGLSYGSFDWYLAAGPVNQLGTMAGIQWALYLLVIPLYYYHKRLYELSLPIIEKI